MKTALETAQAIIAYLQERDPQHIRSENLRPRISLLAPELRKFSDRKQIKPEFREEVFKELNLSKEVMAKKVWKGKELKYPLVMLRPRNLPKTQPIN